MHIWSVGLISCCFLKQTWQPLSKSHKLEIKNSSVGERATNSTEMSVVVLVYFAKQKKLRDEEGVGIFEFSLKMLLLPKLQANEQMVNQEIKLPLHVVTQTTDI